MFKFNFLFNFLIIFFSLIKFRFLNFLISFHLLDGFREPSKLIINLYPYDIFRPGSYLGRLVNCFLHDLIIYFGCRCINFEIDRKLLFKQQSDSNCLSDWSSHPIYYNFLFTLKEKLLSSFQVGENRLFWSDVNLIVLCLLMKWLYLSDFYK